MGAVVPLRKVAKREQLQMSAREIGFKRDKLIVETIERYRCLNTDQIQKLVFDENMKPESAKRKCQIRLNKLSSPEVGKIKKWRYNQQEPYAYYCKLNKPVEQMEHLIALNWVLIWMQKSLNRWGEVMEDWQYEVQGYKDIRPDSFITFSNRLEKTFDFSFVELDRSWESNKVPVGKYIKLYENKNAYANQWWVKKTKRFPRIVIVATDEKRREKIEKTLAEIDTKKLRFKVYSMNQLLKDLGVTR